MSTVIAERAVEIEENGALIPGSVQVYAPELHPDDDEGPEYWKCQIALNFGAYQRSSYVGGVDAFQALLLALKLVPSEIEISPAFRAGTLRLWGDPLTDTAQAFNMNPRGEA